MDGWERVGCSLGRACTHAPLSNDGRRTQEVSPKDAAGSPQQMELHGPGRVVHSCGTMVPTGIEKLSETRFVRARQREEGTDLSRDSFMLEGISLTGQLQRWQG